MTLLQQKGVFRKSYGSDILCSGLALKWLAAAAVVEGGWKVTLAG